MPTECWMPFNKEFEHVVEIPELWSTLTNVVAAKKFPLGAI